MEQLISRRSFLLGAATIAGMAAANFPQAPVPAATLSASAASDVDERDRSYANIIGVL
jgi:hypothetical protein